MRKRLGCLTPGGIIAAVATLAGVGLLVLFTGGSLFSPGPLNAESGSLSLGGVTSHAEIGGRCAACHAAPWSENRMSDRCTVCHTAIWEQLLDQTALHGALLTEFGSLVCRECHPEHRGATGLLTLVTEEGFPHQAVGFSLIGHGEMVAGEPFSCRGCHGDDPTTFDLARCQSCHEELAPIFMADHRGSFGLACLGCHDGLDSYGEAFDHDRLSFPLVGQHIALACDGCHSGARAAADLRQTPADCAVCHAEDDAHDGRLGQGCEACHTPAGWGEVSIDHSLTEFPLTGAHVDVDCGGCHENQVLVGTPTECFSCHGDDDAHDGRLGERCEACHTPAGWGDARIDHSLTAFPLTGAHVDVDCEGCHENEVFVGTPTECFVCHGDDDAHDGRLGQGCDECHTPDDWDQATIDHSLTAFPLTGAHVDVDCGRCHENQVFVGAPTVCFACHSGDDTHDGRLGDWCERCHTPDDWGKATIDHSLTVFPLTGAHVDLACESCHVNQVFVGTPKTCVGCHPEPAFHLGALGTDCAACHGTAGWLPALFDRIHQFPFGHGAPAVSSCRTCHPDQLQSYTCYGCHEHIPAEIEAEHLDEGIVDLRDCANCHPTGLEDEAEDRGDDV